MFSFTFYDHLALENLNGIRKKLQEELCVSLCDFVILRDSQFLPMFLLNYENNSTF